MGNDMKIIRLTLELLSIVYTCLQLMLKVIAVKLLSKLLELADENANQTNCVKYTTRIQWQHTYIHMTIANYNTLIHYG